MSVVIANHDYERFVGTAVRSALALDWPDVEVVVVDDGSTDGSVALLRGWGDRIRLHVQENAGQRVAVNVGFSMSTGDVVVFLDADDVLPSDLPPHLDRAMVRGVSKVQLQAQRIDEDGLAFGRPFPPFRRVPSAATVRRWMTQTTAYPTAPGSANAYARWYLERVLPAADMGDQAADSALLAAAPLLGDVVTVPAVPIGYRRHGANDSRMIADAANFAREVHRARIRWLLASRALGRTPALTPLRRSRELLQLRAAASRMTPDELALPGERRRRLVFDALRSPLHPGPETLAHRAAVLIWTLGVVLLPPLPARRLIAIRYGGPR